jgi:GT2 family glycosyltransferase/glycosyltransferase involved in cell wall biosynthesis
VSEELRDPGSIVFQHPPSSQLEVNQVGFVVHASGSAGVALDEGLVRLWQWADGRTQAELASIYLFRNAPALEAKLAALRLAGLLLPPLERSVKDAETLSGVSLPLVSVVIVTRNGHHHLEECLPSLDAQTYPRIEVIVVDEHSEDGTEEFLRRHFSDFKLVKQKGGPNFAAGCNLGIKHSAGEWILLLNNDTVLDPSCIQEMVAAQAGHTRVGGVAAMLRFYHNRPFVNGLGAHIPPVGFGHDLGIGSLNVGQFDDVEQVPILCFGAALLSREALEQVGLLDEAYEFYYEDADWSYRARALGLKLLAAPRAKVYHKFGASMGGMVSTFKTRRATRNRLRFALKHFSVGAFLRALIAHWREDGSFLLRYLSQAQPQLAGSIIVGWLEFLWSVPRILLDRGRMWKGRQKQTVDLAPFAAPFPSPEMVGSYPRLTEWAVENRYQPYLTSLTSGKMKRRLLIISPDVIDVKMGGVGMRYWELAQVLSKYAQLTLAVPAKTLLVSSEFSIQTYEQGLEHTLRPLVEAADIILLSGFAIYHHPFLRNIPQYLAIDLYDPAVLENLERFSTRSLTERRALNQVGVATYNELLAVGDFFVCASEKQRDYWLGALTAAGRITPDTYTADHTLRRLIDVVPFGIQGTPPQHTRQVLKGVYPGIEENDKVILWGGGLWDWLDPLTVIEAMPIVLQDEPQARLFFMGTRHPNPQVPPSRMAQRAIERATELGLKDQAIFFNDWVEYSERANYLLESDVGVSLHEDHIETRFSFRTRLMDYLWTNLPMLVSSGDVLSDWVRAEGLGCVVAPGDVESVARGLVELLSVSVDRSRFASLGEGFHWARVAEPLVRYIRSPWYNGKRQDSSAPAPTPVPVTPLWQLPRKAIGSLQHRGVSGLWREVRSYVIWRLTQS